MDLRGTDKIENKAQHDDASPHKNLDRGGALRTRA
jgi:hypothetical protein